MVDNTDAAGAAPTVDVPLLILDIDGTVRQGKDDELGRFVNGPEDVRVFPEAIKHMNRWRERGGRIIGVSNQGGIELGYTAEEQVKAAMLETLDQCRGMFDQIVWCPHHPTVRSCWCRKPRPAMVIDTIHAVDRNTPIFGASGEHYPPNQALFVGDRTEDRLCARNLGVKFMWATNWRTHGDDPNYHSSVTTHQLQRELE